MIVHSGMITQPSKPVPPVTESPVYDLLCTGLFHEWSSRTPGYRPAGGTDWLLILTLAGGGIVQTAPGQFSRARAGDLALYRPHAPQWYGPDPESKSWTLVWVHFQPRPHWLEWVKTLGEAAPGLHWIHLDAPAFFRVRRNLLAMHRLARQAAAGRRDHAMNRLEAALLACRDAVGMAAAPRRNPCVDKALAWLDRRLAVPVTVTEMAAAAGLSVSGFAHRFRAETGLAPLQYVDWRRMERAKELLLMTPLTVKEVAAELGFGDPFYFSRRFRRHTGLNPAAWRRQIRPPPAQRPGREDTRRRH